MSFVNLHVHTEYSFLDGAIKVNDLFEHVKSLGQDSVAITEHGNMQSMINKYKASKKAGVKLIFGLEAYIVDDITVRERGNNHIILFAKNKKGLKNLIKLTSIAYKDGFYYKPRIDINLLRTYSEGLICTSACLGGKIPQLLLNDKYDEATVAAGELMEIFGDDFYFELHNHGIDEETTAMNMVKKLAKDLNVKCVVASDAHYLKPENAEMHEIMLCIQTKSTISSEKRFKFSGDGYYIYSEDEAKKRFPNNLDAVMETQKLADKCNVELDLDTTIFPEFILPKGYTDKSFLKHLCYKEYIQKYQGTKYEEEAKERLDFELSVIDNMGFNAYFLIVYDFVKAAKERTIVGPGRGSCAGSIVSYLLGITQLCPLEYGLLFERFLNPDRVSLPDIDLDFADRDVVIDYVKEKYGEDKVALIGTYGTMSAKMVLKDVLRAMDVSFAISNSITPYITEKTIKKSLDLKNSKGDLINTKLIQARDYNEKEFEIAQGLEGTVRHSGIHACGVVWGKKEITEYCPTLYRHGNVVTQMDKDEVEGMGLVKFDFLGLETLNVTKNILNMINKDSKWIENIPIDDKKTFEMLAQGKSTGVFQLESSGMKHSLKIINVDKLDDIIAVVALYRPGPMKYIQVYANRKAGREKISYPNDLAKDILKSTYGIMVYQEQVMKLSQVLAGFTRGEADVLRKAIGKKKLDLMKTMEDKFKKGCVRIAKMTIKDVDKLWTDIVDFADYSFNLSHAACYGTIAYRTAYLKAHYPTEFYTALITSASKDIDKTIFYMQEAKKEGINFATPDINLSGISYTPNVEEKIITCGLGGIKGVGEKALANILDTRPYESFEDMKERSTKRLVNRRVFNALISSGALDSFDESREDMFNKNNVITKKDVPEKYSEKKILKLEESVLGVLISGNIAALYKASKLKIFNKIKTLREDDYCRVFGVIKNYEVIITKKGDEMLILFVEDTTMRVKVLVFPRTYAEIKGSKFDINTPVEILGTYKDGIILTKGLRFFDDNALQMLEIETK